MKLSNPIAIFLLLIHLYYVSTVPMMCQFVTNTWIQGKKFKLNDREMLVSTRYGFDMIIDPIDQAVSRSIRDKGTWQPELVHVMVMFTQPGYTILNLGSQSGMEAIILGKIIGPNGHLYVFEPSSISYRILLKNIYLNDLQDITHAYRVGAGQTQSEGELLTYPQNTGGAEIYLKKIPFDLTERNIDIQRVYVDLVDNVLPKEAVINFALIDVQKMQVEALLGMKNTIQRSPDMVMLVQWQYQVNPRRNQQKTLRLIEWLISLKYKVYIYQPKQTDICSMGHFQQLKDPFQLVQIAVQDIIIAPSHIDPNKLH